MKVQIKSFGFLLIYFYSSAINTLCYKLPPKPSCFEHLHYKARRQAMGEYGLQILDRYAVVLTHMLLPMLGLGNENANKYNGE